MRGVLAFTLAGACSGPQAPPHALESSWLGELRRDPARFAAWVDTGREGWIALHANRLEEAALAPGPAAAVAAGRLALLHEDLARLSGSTWALLLERWDTQSGLPTGSALTWFGALAALDAGDQAAARRWLERCVAEGAPPAQQAAQALLAAELDLSRLDLEAPPAQDNPLLARLRRDLEAQRRGEALASDAALPAWDEPAGALRRRFYDPLLPRTQALAWGARAQPTPDTPALFGPCLTPPLRPAQECTRQALEALGVPPLGAEDDPEAARALGRALGEALDAWAEGPLAGSTAEAQDLVYSLDLLDQSRAQWLEALARQAQHAGRPRQALTLAQIALDLERPREIGPVNAPSLYALAAEAALRLGYTREALDALEVLAQHLPEAQGLDELAGDLSILAAMNRQGESKEN